jgi:hypothetical protein
MNVLFLDLHGVIETTHSLSHEDYDVECVQNLKQCIHQTGAKVVVTSNDKLAFGPKELSSRIGVEVFDVTPHVPYGTRGDEIQEWLENAPYKFEKVECFVIVDDDDDMGPYRSRLVQTRYDEGLTKEKTTEIIRRLTQ